MTSIRSVWFWLPFHMLQAYPMVRNLPLPDFMVPFAHLMWVIMYIAEHWTGLAGPVKAAFDIGAKVGTPFQGICLLSFFFSTFIMTEKKLLVAIGFVLYIGFMLGAKKVGLIGSPKKTYDGQIEASADPKWNDHHVILHVWYITILWVVALTVPYQELEHQSIHPLLAIIIMIAAVVWIVGMLLTAETAHNGNAAETPVSLPAQVDSGPTPTDLEMVALQNQVDKLTLQLQKEQTKTQAAVDAANKAIADKNRAEAFQEEADEDLAIAQAAVKAAEEARDQALNNALAKDKELNKALAALKAAEEAAAAALAAQKLAEDQAQAEEAARKAEEDARIKAEHQAALAEKARQSAEAARAQAEARANKEQAEGDELEADLKAAEAAKLQAEEDAKAALAAQQATEDARAQASAASAAALKAAVEAQKAAEANAQAAAAAKKQADEDRIEAETNAKASDTAKNAALAAKEQAEKELAAAKAAKKAAEEAKLAAEAKADAAQKEKDAQEAARIEAEQEADVTEAAHQKTEAELLETNTALAQALADLEACREECQEGSADADVEPAAVGAKPVKVSSLTAFKAIVCSCPGILIDSVNWFILATHVN